MNPKHHLSPLLYQRDEAGDSDNSKRLFLHAHNLRLFFFCELKFKRRDETRNADKIQPSRENAWRKDGKRSGIVDSWVLISDKHTPRKRERIGKTECSGPSLGAVFSTSGSSPINSQSSSTRANPTVFIHRSAPFPHQPCPSSPQSSCRRSSIALPSIQIPPFRRRRRASPLPWPCSSPGRRWSVRAGLGLVPPRAGKEKALACLRGWLLVYVLGSCFFAAGQSNQNPHSRMLRICLLRGGVLMLV